MPSLTSIIFQLTLMSQVSAESPFYCSSTGDCQNDEGSIFSCKPCLNQDLLPGEDCPFESDPVCSGESCQLTASNPSHTFALDTSATPIEVEDYQTLFSPSPDCQFISCTNDAPGQATVSAAGVISASVDQIYNIGFSVTCLFGSQEGTASVNIIVECASNSTTLTSTLFPTTQTVTLHPAGTPRFTFTPYFSSEAACPVGTVASGTADSFIWSSHFVSSAVGNQVTLVSAEANQRRTLNFYLVFRANGGVLASVACILETRCAEESVPLLVSDFQSQDIHLQRTPPYYEVGQVAPDIPDCTPIGYYAGSATDHTATPPGLFSAAQLVGSTLRIHPVDPNLKVTYEFYIWAQLPDSAFSKVGPIELRAGCADYIDTTIIQVPGFDQRALSNSGGTYSMTIGIKETNIGEEGKYRLELLAFSSQLSACPASAIKTYQLSTSNSDPTLAPAQATLAYSPGDSPLSVMLDISSVGAYSFFIWAKDDETRWDNQVASGEIQINVICGQLEVTQERTSVIVNRIGNFASQQFEAFQFASFFTCDALTFTTISEPSNLGTLTHDGTINALFTVQTSDAETDTWTFKGITAQNEEAIFSVDITVCGKERITARSDSPYVIVADATHEAETRTVRSPAEIMALFDLDTSESHPDCEINKMKTCSKADCTECSKQPADFPAVFKKLGYQVYELRLMTETPRAPQEYFICYFSLGYVTASKPIYAEVCGLEVPSVSPSSKITKSAFVGGPRILIKQEEYSHLFSTGSQYCLVKTFSLKQLNADTNSYSPYEGPDFKLDKRGTLSLSPSRKGVFIVFIEGKTHNGASAYLPVEITIKQPPNTDSVKQIGPQLNRTEESLEVVVDESQAQIGFELSKFMSAAASSVKIDDNGLFFARINEETKVIEVNKQALELEGISNYTFKVIVQEENALKLTVVSLVLEHLEEEKPQVNLVKVGDTLQAEETEEQADVERPEVWEASADSDGHVSFKFYKPMMPLNPTTIDNKTISLSLFEEDENAEASILAWSCSEFTATQMTIALSFQDFSAVSARTTTSLRMTLLDFTRFRHAPQERRRLQSFAQPGMLIIVELPRQNDPSPLGKSLQAATQSAAASVKSAAAFSSVANLIMGQSMSQVWSLVNVLQIVVHMPLLKHIQFPQCLQDFYDVLLPLATFDFLPPEWSTELVFNFQDELDQDEYHEYLLLDYEAHSAISNLGSIFWFIAYSCFTGLLVYLSRNRWRCGLRALSKKKVRRQRNRFLSGFLTILLESSLELFIVLYLNLLQPSLRSFADSFSLLFALAFGFLATVWLSIFIWKRIVRLTPTQVELLEFKEQTESIGPLYEGLRLETGWARAYNLLFIWRRLLLVALFVLFRELLCIQIQALIILNLAQCFYLISVKPLEDKASNRIETLNEMTILAFSWSLPVFSSFSSSTRAAYTFGLFVILMLVVNVIANTLLALGSSLRALYFRLRFKWEVYQERERKRRDQVKAIYSIREQNRTAEAEARNKVRSPPPSIQPQEEEKEDLPPPDDIFSDNEKSTAPLTRQEKKKLARVNRILKSFEVIAEERKESEASLEHPEMDEIRLKLDETIEQFEAWKKEGFDEISE